MTIMVMFLVIRLVVLGVVQGSVLAHLGCPGIGGGSRDGPGGGPGDEPGGGPGGGPGVGPGDGPGGGPGDGPGGVPGSDTSSDHGECLMIVMHRVFVTV